MDKKQNISGLRIRQVRLQRGLDQVELAAALNVDYGVKLEQSDISEIERQVRCVKDYKTYQLVSLTLSEKRVPRIKLSNLDWQKILEQCNYKCAVCGRSEPEVRFQQDHKIPRTRGGGNELNNWQPLCDECNNFKSTSCRGCQLECEQCSWAFPERFAPLRLSSDNILKLRQYAAMTNSDPHDLLNWIVNEFF
ncbi:MAG: HNH endonuclease [Coleofasciculus sp. C1-SOL-03]|uniref:HNH endonuclease n=1 Tax=Coleofasciculus sp. C1-SOL-03 TaxID=3069522 RepID=UPI0032F80391